MDVRQWSFVAMFYDIIWIAGKAGTFVILAYLCIEVVYYIFTIHALPLKSWQGSGFLPPSLCMWDCISIYITKYHKHWSALIHEKTGGIFNISNPERRYCHGFCDHNCTLVFVICVCFAQPDMCNAPTEINMMMGIYNGTPPTTVLVPFSHPPWIPPPTIALPVLSHLQFLCPPCLAIGEYISVPVRIMASDG